MSSGANLLLYIKKKSVIIQQYPICTRSDRAVYYCIAVFAYLLHGLLMHIYC